MDESRIFVGPDVPDPLDVSDVVEIPADLGALAARARPALVEQFLGIIRSSACASPEGTYADARYSIDRAAPDYGSESNDRLSGQPEQIPGLTQCLTATNLAELPDNTHLLPPGTLVQVFALYARGGGTMYLFNCPLEQTVLVRISGNSGGAGEYDGQIVSGSSTATVGGDLSMPAGMTLPSASDALVLNTEETGLPGHRLLAGAYAVGAMRGMTSESPARSIVAIRGALGRADSPTNLPAGGLVADSHAWGRDTTGTPVTMTLVTSVTWDGTNAKLLANQRTLNFDARGILTSVSAETQTTVDSASACA